MKNTNLKFNIISDKISKVFNENKIDILREFLFNNQSIQKGLSSDKIFKVKKFYGVIGRNGAGKSTLLRVLSKIYKPDEGKIYIKGDSIGLFELGNSSSLDLTGYEYTKNFFLDFTELTEKI